MPGASLWVPAVDRMPCRAPEHGPSQFTANGLWFEAVSPIHNRIRRDLTAGTIHFSLPIRSFFRSFLDNIQLRDHLLPTAAIRCRWGFPTAEWNPPKTDL